MALLENPPPYDGVIVSHVSPRVILSSPRLTGQDATIALLKRIDTGWLAPVGYLYGIDIIAGRGSLGGPSLSLIPVPGFELLQYDEQTGRYVVVNMSTRLLQINNVLTDARSVEQTVKQIEPKIIGMDVDGVIFPFIANLMEFYSQRAKQIALERRVNVDDIQMLTTPDKYACWECWNITELEFLELSMEAILAGMLTSKEMQEGVHTIDALHGLVNDGHTIRFITSRYYGDLQHIVEEHTNAWLDSLALGHMDVTFTHAKHEVECDVYLDDSPSTYELLIQKGKICYLYDQPWNKKVDTNRRVFTLGQFRKEINGGTPFG